MVCCYCYSSHRSARIGVLLHTKCADGLELPWLKVSTRIEHVWHLRWCDRARKTCSRLSCHGTANLLDFDRIIRTVSSSTTGMICSPVCSETCCDASTMAQRRNAYVTWRLPLWHVSYCQLVSFFLAGMHQGDLGGRAGSGRVGQGRVR